MTQGDALLEVVWDQALRLPDLEVDCQNHRHRDQAVGPQTHPLAYGAFSSFSSKSLSSSLLLLLVALVLRRPAYCRFDVLSGTSSSTGSGFGRGSSTLALRKR